MQLLKTDNSTAIIDPELGAIGRRVPFVSAGSSWPGSAKLQLTFVSDARWQSRSPGLSVPVDLTLDNLDASYRDTAHVRFRRHRRTAVLARVRTHCAQTPFALVRLGRWGTPERLTAGSFAFL
jgi:hypothetical protein